MPHKHKLSLRKKLETVAKKAGTQLQHRAVEGAKALQRAGQDLNNAAVNHALHDDRSQSKNMLDGIAKQYHANADKFTEAQSIVDALQTEYDEQAKKASEIKSNQEVLAQLEKLKTGGLTHARGAFIMLAQVFNTVNEQELVTKSVAACDAISNAPKTSAVTNASPAAGGKTVEYSKDAAKSIATDSIAQLKTLQSEMQNATNEITQHYDYIKNAKAGIEKTLKEIKDKIFILETYEAAAIPSASAPMSNASAPINPVQPSTSVETMQRQLLEAQAEIARLRDAVVLSTAAAAQLPAGAAFMPQVQSQTQQIAELTTTASAASVNTGNALRG